MTQNFQIPNFDDGAGDKTRAPRPTFGELLENSKLSRLSSLNQARRIFCKNCNSAVDVNDEFQINVGLCKPCLRTYAVVGSVIEKYTEAKIRRNYFGGER